MSDVKVKHKKKKSSFDFKVANTEISPLRKAINNHTKQREQSKLEFSNQVCKVYLDYLKGSMLSSTNPSLIKLVKSQDPSFYDDKQIPESDIKNIVNKYEEKNKIDLEVPIPHKIDTPFSCKREGDGGMGDYPANFELEMINSKNKEKCPVINFNKNSDSLNFEEHIFDPVTERECSFINDISVNHSNFIEEEENKNQDVILCISNLEIDTGFGKRICLNTNNNINNILQSEEKLIHKKDLESITNDITRDHKIGEKKNLITDQPKRETSSLSCFKKLLLFTIFLLFISIISGVIYFIIKSDA